MARIPPPEEERRGEAVRMACRVLLSNEVRLLPPDPVPLAAEMGFRLITMSSLAAAGNENPRQYIRHTVGEEAFTVSAGGEYLIVYDDTVRSPERIRFSVFHEFGHILLRHFESWDLTSLPPDRARVLEDEANTFARNFLCPPPILDLVRGDRQDPKWAALFCMSARAWKTRLRTLPIDRKYIDQRTADLLRIQFRDYMFGRRCEDCGAVFTDEARSGRCPDCGSRVLIWNPALETREQARARKHVSGAASADLKPRIGEERTPDLSGYWRLLRKEN